MARHDTAIIPGTTRMHAPNASPCSRMVVSADITVGRLIKPFASDVPNNYS